MYHTSMDLAMELSLVYMCMLTLCLILCELCGILVKTERERKGGVRREREREREMKKRER